ncbi:MAG: RNA polymerase sigma factor [Clostridia bacterium]|nr:RNA polymerase sigma factor [Clostridia bacterium]
MLFLLFDTLEETMLAERLYNKYSKFMFQAAYTVLKNNFYAEDAVQQAFIKIIKNLNKIDENDAKKTRNFIGVITQNTAIDIYNKVKNEPAGLDDNYTTDIKYDISHIIIDRETIERLKTHIKTLKPIYQIPLLLHAEQGLSANEIAEILDLKPKTVQKRIERARAQLIKALNKEDN